MLVFQLRFMMNNKSIVFFGIARGGSSIVSKLLGALANSSGFEVRDLDAEFYDNGINIDDVQEKVFDELLKETSGYYGAFRTLPIGYSQHKANKIRNVFLFRDPRDCLVSRYYAFKNVHSDPSSGNSIKEMKIGKEVGNIDDFVIQQIDEVVDVYHRYLKIIPKLEYKLVYKYEDIAINPVAWINQIVMDLNLQPSASAVNQCTVEAAFTRVLADENQHNRSGVLGQFQTLLKTETIERLNGLLGDMLNQLGYPLRYDEGFKQDDNILLRAELDEMKRAILQLQAQNANHLGLFDKLRKCF